MPYNQSAEFTRAMRGTDVPVDFYSATRKAPGDQADDTRIVPTDAPGHASETARHVVIDTGLDLVSAFARGDRPPPCDRDFTVDGTASPRISPDPGTPASGCPARPSFYGSARPAAARRAAAPMLDAGIVAAPVRSRERLVVRERARERGCKSGVRRVRVAVAPSARRGAAAAS